MTGQADSLTEIYLADALRRLKGHRRLVEKALEQVSDEDFFRSPGGESNAIAVIVKHLSGNMRSRFTDFLTSDGEKPDRHRDGEFALAAESRDALMTGWRSSWETTLAALEKLAPGDLERRVTIAGEPHTAIGAINRHLAHLAYHAGQITYLAKLWAGPRWTTLSIPKGESGAYFDALRKKHGDRG